MRKWFVVLAIGVLTCAAAFANGNVTGTVFLGPPPAPGAAGATVVLHRNMHPEDSLSTITDSLGHFAFNDIESGGWGAMAILEGHLPGFGMVFVPENGGTGHLDIMLGPPLEDTGSVAGTVLRSDGTPAGGAMVHLAQEWDPMHPHGFMTMTMADSVGAFGFPVVPAGNYDINAGLMGAGFASADIEVLANQTTNVVLTLSDNHIPCDTCHHIHPCDSLVLVDLTGTVIVVADSGMHHFDHYFLDVNGDGQADYRLEFGPPWYDPNGPDAPNRPANGDQISVHGGLLTYGEPPMVVVYQINGLFWQDPCHHGGHGGFHWFEGCHPDPDSITAIEVQGTAIVTEGPHGWFGMYAIDTNGDTNADYDLLFGPPWYDPNGPDSLPNRPANGDEIAIVGGLMQCDSLHLGMIIVYEINGMVWREPGDTSGFTPEALSVGEPVEVPVNYLTASNYPNPFNPTTNINYMVPASGRVTLKVYDIVGREVATLVNATQSAGAYSVTWNAANYPSGIYMYRLSAAGHSFTNKMVLMK